MTKQEKITLDKMLADIYLTGKQGLLLTSVRIETANIVRKYYPNCDEILLNVAYELAMYVNECISNVQAIKQLVKKNIKENR